MEQKFQVSRDLLNKISNYLGQRPYAEVASLIQLLSQELANQPKPEGVSPAKPEKKEAEKK